MNFTELCAEVYVITGRPDKVAATESAVKAATLFVHTKDFFYKDIREAGVNFGTAAYLQQMDYRSIFPRYRAFKYLRKWDAVNSSPGRKLDLIDVDRVFDRYGTQKADTCYVAGAYININSSTEEQYYLFGHYQLPDVSTTSFDSWIAIESPWAIINKAASQILIDIGRVEDASLKLKLALADIDIIVAGNIQSEGY